MKYLKTFSAVVCTAVFALSLSACSTAKSTSLGAPAAHTALTYEEMTSAGFAQFKAKVDKFASTFSEYAYADTANNDNFAVSPVSVYMALSLASECSDGQTREQILSALGVTHSELKENYPLLYRSLMAEHKSDGQITGLLIPSNSIWVNEGTPVNQSCIEALSEYYFAYSYSADFKNDNISANKAIRNFVKEQTKGIIDKDFKMSEETLFTLINTLYLKTIWNDSGDDLPVWGNREFTNFDGTSKNTELLRGYYNSGRVYESEKYSAFFTETYDGYKIKFILPNEGYSLDEVFTSENISEVNSIKSYSPVDNENKIQYFTRCIFPEYKCGYDSEIDAILKEKYGITDFFDAQVCDFSNLSSEQCFCGSVRHVSDLTVNKKGIEGASVTVIVMDGTSAPPYEYEVVYEDFIVDKAFGFILTDPYGVTLFSGAVKTV